VDTELWHLPTEQERKQLRQGLGFEETDFVMLTVADNQERKNLWAGMKIAAQVAKNLPDRNVRYMMVTREDSQVGWRLRSLAKSEGIMKEFIPFQRGMPTHDLWGLFACADVYLQPSKAEGLGLPLMEAMGCGVPCVATDTGAMHELLQDNRGLLAGVTTGYIDVWGNSMRHLIDIDDAARLVTNIATVKEDPIHYVDNALAYVKARTWDIPVQQVNDKIAEIFNEPKQAQKEG
jgi:glycosyltransferase involved in cell wall biosynthesis